MVAYDIVTGIYIRWGPKELVLGSTPPFTMGDDTLVVTFFGSAEMGCFLALGWPMPRWLLDLYAEFRWLTSGRKLPLVGEPAGKRRRSRHSLLAALGYFGLDGIAAIEKEAMRQLAMRGGPYTPVEVQQLLDYCQTDVDSSAKLFERMRPHLDLPRALLRGRYVQAVARMEWIGVPVDKEMLAVLRRNWEPLKADLVSRVDAVA
ncbi:MAG: DNA polymerase I, partial [Limisphaerales bacterium]